MHAVDLLPTLREVQERRALEGKPELEVAFYYFSTAFHGKTGREHSRQELSEAAVLRAGRGLTDFPREWAIGGRKANQRTC